MGTFQEKLTIVIACALVSACGNTVKISSKVTPKKLANPTATATPTANNQAPTLTSVSSLTGAFEDTPFTLTYEKLFAASNAVDADSQSISFRVEAVSSGTLTKNTVAIVAGETSLAPNETLIWTPAANVNGTGVNAFTVKAFDNTTASAETVQVKVDVAAVNDTPTLTTVSTLTGATEDTAYTVNFASLLTASNAVDPDGDLLEFRVEALSSGTLTKNGTNVTPGTTRFGVSEALVWTPAANANGNINAFTIKVFDGVEYSSTAVQVVIATAAVNDIPTLTTVTALAGATEDTAFTITYDDIANAANEADIDGTTLSFRIEAVSSGTLTKSGTGVTPTTTIVSVGESLVWTPAANVNGNGVNAFTIKAFDGVDASTSAIQVAVNVTAVNDAPTVAAIANQTTKGGVAVNGLTFTVDEGGGTDEDAQGVTVTAASSNTTLIPDENIRVNYTADTTSDATGGTFDIAPMIGTGTVTITITVSDGTTPVQTTFTVTVGTAPISTSGLSLWLAADGPHTKDSSNLVSSWKDISGGVIAFQQSTDAQKPTFISNGGASFNSKPVMRFNGTTNVLDAGDVLNSVFSGTDNKISIFVVLKVNDTANAKPILSKYGDGGWAPPEDSRQFTLSVNASEVVSGQASYSSVCCNRNIWTSTSSIAASSKIVSYQYDGSVDANSGAERIRVFLNGSLETVSSPLTGALGDMASSSAKLSIGASLGAAGTTPGASFMDGDIAEIIVYNRDMTVYERQSIEAFLSVKYDVSVLLPTDQTLWLRADKGLYTDTGCSVGVTANNDPVACWQDYSGSSNNVTQATANFRPLYKTAGLNLMPSIHVDSNDILTKVAATNSMVSMFGVVKQDVSPSTDEWWFLGQQTGAASMSIHVDNGNNRLRLTAVGSNGVNSSVNVANTYAGTTAWIQSGTATSFANLVFGNGKFIGTRAAGGPKDASGGDIFVNWYEGPTDTADIAELIGYHTEVNAFDRNRVETYLNYKYNTSAVYTPNPLFNATDLRLWLSADSGLTTTDLAAQFTAANSESLSVADNAALSTGDIDYSISAWVYLDSKTAWRQFVLKWDVSGSNSEFAVNYDPGNDRFSFGVSSNGIAYTTVLANNFGSPSTGSWHFITVWHDSINNQIGIKVNNGTANTASYSSGGFDSTSPLTIGTGGGAYYHDGRIAKVGFWKKVLSTVEIGQLYNAGKGRSYLGINGSLATNLISYWNLNEASGTRNDSHSTNHLTDNNTVTSAAGVGSAVSAWADQSGNGIDAIQTDSTNRPEWITDAEISTRPAIRFNGTSHFLTSNFATSMRTIGDRDAFTALAVVHPFDTGTARSLMGSTHATTPDFVFKFTTAAKLQFYGSQSAANSTASTTSLSTGGRSIVSISDDSAGGIAYFLNGAADGTSTHLTYGVTDADLFIGKWNTQFWYGDVYEIIMFSKALSTIERQAIECYLSSKYGVTLSGVTCS